MAKELTMPQTDMDTWQQATQYTVSAVPEDLCVDAHIWDVTVEYRDAGRWAVKHLSSCLGSDGKWDYEPSPSSRTDEWKDAHRFTKEEALRLAHEVAPTIEVNGLLPADLIAKYRALHMNPEREPGSADGWVSAQERRNER